MSPEHNFDFFISISLINIIVCFPNLYNSHFDILGIVQNIFIMQLLYFQNTFPTYIPLIIPVSSTNWKSIVLFSRPLKFISAFSLLRPSSPSLLGKWNEHNRTLTRNIFSRQFVDISIHNNTEKPFILFWSISQIFHCRFTLGLVLCWTI